jgi:hypothetical protein
MTDMAACCLDVLPWWWYVQVHLDDWQVLMMQGGRTSFPALNAAASFACICLFLFLLLPELCL